ncbi:MAG: guanylate kinase [Steroidobacteraceae bacterium]
MTKTGKLFVISAPSGAGKTSLVKALRKSEPRLYVSISHTTRARRVQELDGREYHFVSPEQFHSMVEAGGFLEHARVFDNHYGTGRDALQAQLAKGHDVVLEIDWQGARQVRAAHPECVSIFILPPSSDALRQRLESRSTDTPAVIARRLADAVTDMSRWNEFDYVVVNDRFEEALDGLRHIVNGEGGRWHAQRTDLKPFLQKLLAP